MSQIIDSVCPLCQSEAKCEEHIMRRLKHFICAVCNEFVIKNKAERHLVKSAPQTRQKFSDYCAKATSGDVTLLSFEPNGVGGAPTVLAEYLPLQKALAR